MKQFLKFLRKSALLLLLFVSGLLMQGLSACSKGYPISELKRIENKIDNLKKVEAMEMNITGFSKDEFLEFAKDYLGSERVRITAHQKTVLVEKGAVNHNDFGYELLPEEDGSLYYIRQMSLNGRANGTDVTATGVKSAEYYYAMLDHNAKKYAWSEFEINGNLNVTHYKEGQRTELKKNLWFALIENGLLTDFIVDGDTPAKSINNVYKDFVREGLEWFVYRSPNAVSAQHFRCEIDLIYLKAERY